MPWMSGMRLWSDACRKGYKRWGWSTSRRGCRFRSGHDGECKPGRR